MTQKKVEKQTITFTKAQFLKSANFKPIEKDALNALLDHKKKYSLEEAKHKLEQFLKKEAK